MNILGIETSCDETAAAVVADGREVKSNLVYSQVSRHQPFGGVVPEIASRCHVEVLPRIIQEALDEAGVDWPDIDAVAVTRGPGLASSLLVGLAAAKALAIRLGVPLMGINHLEAHLYSIFLDRRLPAPREMGRVIVLLVSGGHTCLVEMEGVDHIRLLGQTLDDAAGEALDKGANLLNLGYPGGPAIEKSAEGGDPQCIDFPRGPRFKNAKHTGGLDPDYCFSFSGVKTSLLYYLKKHPDALDKVGPAHLCASYQEAVFDALVNGAERAIRREQAAAFACVGGVSGNRRLRGKLDDLCRRLGVQLVLTPPEYCTDNAAMVAALAGGKPVPEEDPARVDVAPNWGLPRQ